MESANMKIKYYNTEEDIVAFNLHHSKNSPTYKRLLRIVQLLFSCIIIAIVLLWYAHDRSTTRLVAGIVISTLYIFLFSLSSKWSLKIVSIKLNAEGKNLGVLCEHEIEILETGILETTEVGKQESNWAGIERLSETDDYLFIYTGSIMAHVIPKKRVEGDIEVFIEKLNEKLAQAGI